MTPFWSREESYHPEMGNVIRLIQDVQTVLMFIFEQTKGPVASTL
jgi:hypothetical protein